MTVLPAEKFGIAKRGQLKEKYFADIAIINRDEIMDLATVDNPYQYSKGVEAVQATVRRCVELGVEYLTLFAFSSENWRRPADEVSILMQLWHA